MSEEDCSALNATVTYKSDIAPGLIVLRVAPDGWRLPAFEPGQYAVLGLPGKAPRCPDSDEEEFPVDRDKLIKRAYSIASSSRARGYLEFFIALIRSGALTPRLMALNVGDGVWLGRKITGLFTLDSVPEHCHVIMFATGTGLAPYVSMMRTRLVERSSRRLFVVHGARHSWDLGYSGEMLAFQRRFSHFDYLPLISRPGDELSKWSGFVGHCQDVWTTRIIDHCWGIRPIADNTHVFLCGNPDMIKSMEALLIADGFCEHRRNSPGQIHTEKYW